MNRAAPTRWGRSSRSRICIACRPCGYNRRLSQWSPDTSDIPVSDIKTLPLFAHCFCTSDFTHIYFIPVYLHIRAVVLYNWNDCGSNKYYFCIQTGFSVSSSTSISVTPSRYCYWLVSWLVFNGTFSTNRLYHAIWEWNISQHKHIIQLNITINQENHKQSLAWALWRWQFAARHLYHINIVYFQKPAQNSFVFAVVFCSSIINLIRVAYVVRRPCSDFKDMLRHLTNWIVVLLLLLLLSPRHG